MTMPQFRWFFNGLETEQCREMRQNTITSLAGARYDEKALEKLFSDLKGTA